MINPAVLALHSYSSKTIARGLRAGADVIDLSIGEPDFGPPPAANDALSRLFDGRRYTAELKRYERSLGSAELREAIVDYCGALNGAPAPSIDQVLVTHGGAGALTLSILVATEPGDGILIPDPSYMLYARLVTVLGRVPQRFVRSATDGYRYDIERLRSATTPKTRALIVNSPENPTGYVCTDGEMRDMLGHCERHGLTLVHDEVYDQFVFAGAHRSAAALGGYERVIQVNSTSKKFGVPGLRIGWLVANPQFAACAAKAQDYTNLAIHSFSERVATTLLRSADVASWFGEVRQLLRRRAEMGVELLGAIKGVEFSSRVDGGMFLLPRVRGLATHICGAVPGRAAGDVVADWLLDAARVAAVPGGVYGEQCGDSVRFVTCGPRQDFEDALARIATACSSIDMAATR